MKFLEKFLTGLSILNQDDVIIKLPVKMSKILRIKKLRVMPDCSLFAQKFRKIHEAMISFGKNIVMEKHIRLLVWSIGYETFKNYFAILLTSLPQSLMLMV